MMRCIVFVYLTILCFSLYQCDFCNGEATTEGPTIKFRPPSSNAKKIITYKIEDQQRTQQCQCIWFYQCNSNDTVEVPDNGQTCDDLYICCRLPLRADVIPDTTSNPPLMSSPLSGVIGDAGTQASSSSACTCVPTNQCRRSVEELQSGADAINPKQPFCKSSTQICCLPQNIIPDNDVPLTSNRPTTTTGSSVISCSCVSRAECTKSYEELLGGLGQIVPKIPICEPSQHCCPLENIVSPAPPTTESTSPFPPTIAPQLCGVRQTDIQIKITGASDTTFGEFPWMALLLSVSTGPDGRTPQNTFVCGASLLSSSIVLTAAHCVHNEDINFLKVRMGEYDIHVRDVNVERLPHQDRTVSRIITHPDFNPKVLYNDLALIVTTAPFDLDWHINPICAPFIDTEFTASKLYNPDRCLASGWGKTAFDNQEYHTILKKVDLSVLPHDQCQVQLRKTKLGKYFILDPSFVCAGGEVGRDTCEGDGGGPLVCALKRNPAQYIQVGIVSWGIGCGTGAPGVYASLEANKDWLTEQFNTLNIFSLFGDSTTINRGRSTIGWALVIDNLNNLNYYCYQYIKECAPTRHCKRVIGHWKVEKLHYQKLNTNEIIDVTTITCVAPNSVGRLHYDRRYYHITRAFKINCVNDLLQQGHIHNPYVIVFKHCDFDDNQEANSHDDDDNHGSNLIPKTEVKEEPHNTLETLNLFPID